MNSSSEEIAMREYDEMNSYLYWGGCMNLDRFDRDKMIWKYLNLDEVCDDEQIKSVYKIRNKHEDFFRSLKDKVNDWKTLREYVCKSLMIKGYQRLLENKCFNRSEWLDIQEKYLKLSDPEFFYKYYNRKNWEDTKCSDNKYAIKLK